MILKPLVCPSRVNDFSSLVFAIRFSSKKKNLCHIILKSGSMIADKIFKSNIGIMEHLYLSEKPRSQELYVILVLFVNVKIFISAHFT